MAQFTEAQIRSAIAGIIATAAPGAVVFDWWALGHDPNQWPGILKPAAGVDANKVHGYIVTRTQTDGTRVNACRVRRIFTYDVWAFHFYDDASTSATSSDIRFNAELDAICQAFVIGEDLPDALRRVESDGELEFRIDLNTFGGELLHYATGRLMVEQC